MPGHVTRGQTLILGHEPVLIAGTSAPRKLETVRLAWEKIPEIVRNIFVSFILNIFVVTISKYFPDMVLDPAS